MIQTNVDLLIHGLINSFIPCNSRFWRYFSATFNVLKNPTDFPGFRLYRWVKFFMSSRSPSSFFWETILYSIYSHIIHLLSIYLRGEQEHFTLHKLGGLLYRNLRHIPPWSGLFVAGSGLFVSRSGLLSALLTARVARLPPGILHPRTENITILYITVCDFLLCSVILLAHFFKISQADFYTCNMPGLLHYCTHYLFILAFSNCWVKLYGLFDLLYNTVL